MNEATKILLKNLWRCTAKHDDDAPEDAAPFELVCSDTDSEWEAERRKLVTGTVAPQLLGIHRYGSLLSTYLRMRKGAPTQDDVDALNNRETLDWGTDQQTAIIRNLRRRLGLDACAQNVLLRSKEHPWAGCTLDGWIYAEGPSDGFPFEVKTTRSPTIAELWTEGVPDFVDAQVQWQMLVTGAPKSLVAVTLFGAPPVFSWVERDNDRIGQLIELGEAFARDVLEENPPAPDGSEADDRAVDQGAERGKVVELDIEAVTMTERIADLAAQLKTLKTEERELKQRIRVQMGDAERGNLPGDELGAWKVITRSTPASLVVSNHGSPAAEIGARLDWVGSRVRELVLEDDEAGIMAVAQALDGLDVKVKGTDARESSHIRRVK